MFFKNEGNIERNQFLVTEFLSQILKIILARNFDDRKHEEIIFLVLKSCFKFLVQNIHLEVIFVDIIVLSRLTERSIGFCFMLNSDTR